MGNTFDDIRPFDNDEIESAIAELLNEPQFVSVVEKLYPQPDASKALLQKMAKIKTVEEFQSEISYTLLKMIIKNTTDGVTYNTMDHFDPYQSYLFISDHRDIILDSAFLNVLMQDNGLNKTEIAIGDNLLIYKWIKLLVRINRSFIVKRDLKIREQLEASKQLSSYIRHTITEKKNSIWIAQREGRTKDGNDQTQIAILKMLNITSCQDHVNGLRELNIVPMSISYEFEPCGKSKIEELLERKTNPNFCKTQKDDLKSMAMGVMNYKGRIHYSFGNPLNIRLDELTEGKKYSDQLKSVAEFIDKRIYHNYKLWPNNYIAYDWLHNTTKYSDYYTFDQKETFTNLVEKDSASTKFDPNEFKQMYLSMYAYPIINYEKHFGKKIEGNIIY